MSADRAFVDTNIFAYLYSDDEPEKQEKARSSISGFQRFISTQVLNEFCNVCIRKRKLPIPFVKKAINEICAKNNLVTVDEATVTKALDLHEKYEFSYFDCLMIASAIESECQYLLSEDMADGQIIDGSLTIKNIFA